MFEKLRIRLILGPAMVALACLLGMWSLIRPATLSSLQTVQRGELSAQLARLVHSPSHPPAGIRLSRPAWEAWLRRQVLPPHRLTLLSAEGTLLADSQVDEADSARPASVDAPGPPLFDEALDARGPDTWTDSHHLPDGSLEQFAVARLSGVEPPLYLRLAGPDRTGAEMEHLSLLMMSLVAIASLMGLSLSFLDAARISATLLEFKGMVRQMRRKDFQRRVEVEGEFELRLLALELNKLARTLGPDMADLDGSRSRLWGVVDGMSEGVLVTDRHGVVILANRALGHILRFQVNPVGRSPLELVRSPELSVALQQAWTAPEPATVELELRFPEPRYIVVRLSRWGDEDAPAGIVVVMHDVSDMRRLEQVRRDFVANASHELRTPVAAIRGYAEALLDGDPLPDEARSFVQIIERNSQRLGALVDDILSLARIESPTFRAVMEAVDLPNAVSTVSRSLSSLALERQVRVTCLAESTLPLARADRKAVEHVLTNLIENALKYTAPGGRCDVRVSFDGRLLRLEVEDTGVGIPPDDLNRVFERFYRVDSARSRAVGGTGLGLAIVKHLVLAMGGEVSVRSTYGIGSTFTVTLLPVSESSESVRGASSAARIVESATDVPPEPATGDT